MTIYTDPVTGDQYDTEDADYPGDDVVYDNIKENAEANDRAQALAELARDDQ